MRAFVVLLYNGFQPHAQRQGAAVRPAVADRELRHAKQAAHRRVAPVIGLGWQSR
jgi:hypothetical protein